MKTCFKCGIVKPTTEFYRHPMMSDGLLGKCKACTKLDATRRRARKLDEIQAYDRARANDPKRVAARCEYGKRYKVEHHAMRQAHILVGNALRDGKLVRTPCVECGSLKADAHHHDYSKPLDVTWLCPKCHHAKHRKYDYAKLLAV